MARGLVVLATAAVALAAAPTIEDGVVVLTPDSFKDVVGKDVPVFVEFYAPWCGHCKSLAPEWAALASTFSKADGVVIAKVDADAHKSLGNDYDVKGFPTIKWFPAGSLTPEDYSGGRTADELVPFVNGKIGTSKRIKKAPTAVVDLTPENFDAIVGAPGVAKFVEFYAPWCGHCKSLAPVWEKLAKAFDGEKSVVIAKVDADKHKSLGSRFGVQGFPTLKFFPAKAGTPEEVVAEYNGGRDLKELVEHVNSEVGTARTPEGGLLPTAGRIAELDELAAGFVASASQAKLLAEATELAAGHAGKATAGPAELYVKTMGKIVEKGATYVAKEAARLAKVLAGDAVAPAKKAELLLKRNVLAAFAPEAKEEAAVDAVPQ